MSKLGALSRSATSGVLTVSQARVAFAHNGNMTDEMRRSVRPEIAMSWLRSRASGVSTQADIHLVELDERAAALNAASSATMDRLRDSLRDSTSVCELVLTDGAGRVVTASNMPGIRGEGARAVAAVGVSLSEKHVGTNAVGTAITDGCPKVVHAPEHWSDLFGDTTWLAVPVLHPTSRRTAAVIGLSLRDREAHPTYFALLRWAAAELRNALGSQDGDRAHDLVDQFLHRRRSDRSALLISPDFCIADARGAALLSDIDLGLLRSQLIGRAAPANKTRAITLRDGLVVDAAVHGLADGVSLFVELNNVGRDRRRVSDCGASTSRVHARALSDLRGAVLNGESALVTGEPGVGKLTAAVHAARDVEGSVAVVDVADGADVATCLKEIRSASARGDGAIIVAHLDQAHDDVLAALQSVIAEATPGRGISVIATAIELPRIATPGLSSVRRFVFERLAERHIALVPLRNRPSDIPTLVAQISHSRSARTRWAPEALDLLTRVAWPGNVRELAHAVHRTLARDLTIVTKADLPADIRGQAGRHRLSWMERVERDALIAALQASGGNKVQAALELGISRSSLYRKLNHFGL